MTGLNTQIELIVSEIIGATRKAETLEDLTQVNINGINDITKLVKNLSLYGVVFNEADLVSSDSISDAPEPLWKSYDLDVEDGEVELCGKPNCNRIKLENSPLCSYHWDIANSQHN